MTAMNFWPTLLIIVFWNFCLNVSSWAGPFDGVRAGRKLTPKVIYGRDDRVEVVQAPQIWQELARSTVTIVRSDQIVEGEKKDHFKLIGPSFWNKERLCSDEPFREQKMVGHCSAFLIGPDLVATAGHCIRDNQHCKTLAYVFDVQVKENSEYDYEIPKENFYACEKLIDRVENKTIGLDYALVKLTKKVKGRGPLKYRQHGGPQMQDEMAVIGHPYGIPKKFADNGFILSNHHPYFFKADLDTYSFNSGSPVFNVSTLEVEGILVRGEEDFEKDESSGCYRSKVCAPGECSGEEVTRITKVPLP